MFEFELDTDTRYIGWPSTISNDETVAVGAPGSPGRVRWLPLRTAMAQIARSVPSVLDRCLIGARSVLDRCSIGGPRRSRRWMLCDCHCKNVQSLAKSHVTSHKSHQTALYFGLPVRGLPPPSVLVNPSAAFRTREAEEFVRCGEVSD